MIDTSENLAGKAKVRDRLLAEAEARVRERRVYELIALMAKVVVIARVAKSGRMSCPASGPRRTKSA